MYLDTDTLLALIKKEDWLKPHVDIKKINNPKTSVFAIIEVEIILLREYGRESVYSALNDIKSKNIKIIPMEEEILEKALELFRKYSRLNVFDSVHAAFSAIKKEKILSTDHIFDDIEEIKRIDPREAD